MRVSDEVLMQVQRETGIPAAVGKPWFRRCVEAAYGLGFVAGDRAARKELLGEDAEQDSVEDL